MACRGVYFALTTDDVRQLLAADDNESVLAVLETVDRRRDEIWLQTVDKTWDAMHRCLSNGTLYYDEGEYPLNRTVLGGKHLYDGDEYVIAYVAPNEVKEVAAALTPIQELEFRRRYDAIDPDDYDGEHGDVDFGATWEYFRHVRDFYARAASAGRAVVFKVDQ